MARKNFRALMEPILADPERRRRVEAGVRELESEIALASLRRARGFTQRQLGEAMSAPQPRIAQIEKQTDLYLSTLRSYVEAMGGRLEINAIFPDSTIPVTCLGSLDEAEATEESANDERDELTPEQVIRALDTHGLPPGPERDGREVLRLLIRVLASDQRWNPAEDVEDSPHAAAAHAFLRFLQHATREDREAFAQLILMTGRQERSEQKKLIASGD